MELKDVILSTLAEMEDIKPINNDSKPITNVKKTNTQNIINKIKLKKIQVELQSKPKIESEKILDDEQNISDEMFFLTSMRERLLVLFEGFQSPNNENIEAKIDMTLNFLEYVLVTIDSRVKELEKGRY